MGDPGDLLRVRLKKKSKLKLKVHNEVGRAFTPEEKDRLLAAASEARSPHIYMCLVAGAQRRNARFRIYAG